MKNLFLSIIILVQLIGCVKIKQNSSVNINYLLNSTVVLVKKDLLKDYHSSCSGVWISSKHILTAKHCVHDKLINFTTYDKYNLDYPEKISSKIYKALLITDNDDSDLALLSSIDEVSHPHIKLSRDKIIPGQDVSIVGHPSHLGYSFTKGVVSQERFMNIKPFLTNNTEMIQITALVWKGSSGGGAFNLKGELIGITSFIRGDVPGIAFFIHRNSIVEFLKKEGYSENFFLHSE